MTPAQQPYLPKLTSYSALLGRPQTRAAGLQARAVPEGNDQRHEVRDRGGVS